MLNYKRELENKSLKDIHALAREEWEKYLSRIEIEDPNKTKNIVSYFDIMNGGDLNDIAMK